MSKSLKKTNIAVLAVALVFALATPFMTQATSISSSATLVTASNTNSNTNVVGVGANGLVEFAEDYPTAANVVSGNSITQVAGACSLTVNGSSDLSVTVFSGANVNVTWDTSTYSSLTIGGTTVTSGSYTFSNVTSSRIVQIAGFSASGAPCAAQIIITCVPVPVDCRLEITKTVNKAAATPGEQLTYTITVKNNGSTNCTKPKIVDQLDTNIDYLSYSLSGDVQAGYNAGSVSYNVYEAGSRTLYFTGGNELTPGESVTITWVGTVKTPAQCGDFDVKNQAKVTAKQLNNYLQYEKSNIVTTVIDYDCPTPTVPNCDSFTASPATILTGTSATLSWETTNATRVTINNGIGNVAADGSKVVSPLVTTTYILSVYDGNNNITDNCQTTVTVTSSPVPVCDYLRASDTSITSGQQVTLTWETTNATNVSLNQGIGAVAVDGSRVVSPSVSTTYVLTYNGQQDTACRVTVNVNDQPEVFTCPNNVDFRISDSSIRRGERITLDWNVTGADTVSITGIGSVSRTGSQSFEPSSDTTYTLTATKAGYTTINCPVSVNVSSGGGGGGGSSSPRCDLDISDTRITRGETITLSWDTSRANDITIIDDRGRIIVETDDDEGEIEVTPTRDTQYTLIAERGSRDRECEVEVEVEEGQVLGVVRDQQPLVAGIALSQVPYTGFEAGPVLTLMFYLLLMAWALYIAYFFVVRRESSTVPSMHLATPNDVPTGTTITGAESMKKAEEIRPDAFVGATATEEAPANLPTSEKTIGYASYFGGTAMTESQADQIVTELENRAHSQRALLSSDAVAFFMNATEGSTERNEVLDTVISEAKAAYPLEDGWVVLNKTRMETLCADMEVKTAEAHETLPVGSGSLAEAIVTGNIVAAYEMIGNRPMFALAEAAADLDSVVRNRKDDSSPISDLLKTETKNITDEQLQNTIKALTGAIDGTYSDEAAAVKMAIMKAVKELS